MTTFLVKYHSREGVCIQELKEKRKANKDGEKQHGTVGNKKASE